MMRRTTALWMMALTACEGSTAVPDARMADAMAPDAMRSDTGPRASRDAGAIDAFVSPPVRVDALPPLPGMSNVSVRAGDHVMTISFDPVEGARDYRVYAVPAAGDVLVDGADPTRLVGVRGATYRCAGTHEAPVVNTDSTIASYANNCELNAVIDSSMPYSRCGTDPNDCYPTAGGTGNHFGEGGYARRPSEIQLGWVYTTPGPDRSPVYVLADASQDAYAECFGRNYTATRNKLYTTDAARAASLRAMGWADFGIAFYVPSTASAATQSIYTTELPSTQAGVQRYYLYTDGDERAFRTSHGQTVTPAFLTLASEPPRAADGTPTAQPLYRVLYSIAWSTFQHDELAVGRARFDDLYGMGQHQSRQEVTFSWSGAPPAGLVLEALDQGCPFQGHIASHEADASSPFEAWTTIDALRARQPNGEVYLNGQFDGTTPTPIARAFVGIESAPRPPLDFASTYESTDPGFTEILCTSNCDAGSLRLAQSDQFDVTFNGIEATGDRWSITPLAGQLWVRYSDVGADVGAQFRMTARPLATMHDDTFLYATMEVDSVSTARRYPQIVIHERTELPLWQRDRAEEMGLDPGRSIVLQSFEDWPSRVTLEVCTNRGWAVNHQCPEANMRELPNGRYAPVYDQADRASLDHMSRFEIYASTQRAYVFYDGAPYGCVDFDAGAAPSGPVRVTFGDVLYHSGADEGIKTYLPDGFLRHHELTLAERHFGPVGFSSGVAEPEWDEASMPCVRVAR